MQTAVKGTNWWSSHSTSQRCLTWITIFLILVNNRGVKAGLKHTVSPTKGNIDVIRNGSGICRTSVCFQSASEIMSRMKMEIQPCDDFYQFVCGRYIDEATIPEDKQQVQIFSTIYDNVEKQLTDVITEERSPSDPKYLRHPNALYKACMNKALIETLDVEPIKKRSDSLGGWPVVKGVAWDRDDKWSWQNTVQRLGKNGFSTDYITRFSMQVGLANSTIRTFALDQPSLILSREVLIRGLNDIWVSAYFHYMVDVAVLFGADRAKATKELEDSLNFEIQLANITTAGDIVYEPDNLYEQIRKDTRTLKELQTAYPYIQWLDYMNAFLPEGLTIGEDEFIHLYAGHKFFDKLGPLLARTPKRVIANYLMWRMHEYSLSFLSDKFREVKLKYETILHGRQEQKPRWKECFDLVNKKLEIAVNSLYVQKYFKQDAKKHAARIANNIRTAFNHLLDDVSWMDNATKLEAKTTLRQIKTRIGYEDEMVDSAILGEYYHELDIDPSKFFESFLKINVFERFYSHNKLNSPVNKRGWLQYFRPVDARPFSSPVDNSTQLPAGIMQGHYFNGDRPKYLNYGAIGYIIGSLYIHGFDNLVYSLQPEPKEKYLKKASCIAQQYGNYTEKITNMKLNGISTEDENIADNGGIKLAYHAYRQWAASNEPEPKLPGLNYTPKQMFWISAGQTMCGKARREFLERGITMLLPTSPNEFRVLGPLSNMKYFSEDFQCPEGSPMNPVHKCDVW